MPRGIAAAWCLDSSMPLPYKTSFSLDQLDDIHPAIHEELIPIFGFLSIFDE
jgi:hypothetical protein